MPNLPQQQTIVQYVTSNSQTQYTFAFYAPLPTDIQVYYQASNAPPIPATDILVLNVGYTVTYNADPTTGGYITTLFTPTSGYYLTINRNVQASLNTNFANAQNFNGANLDAALDRLLLLCQQNQNYALQRNLSYVINTYLPNATPYTQLPPLPQNYFWVGSGSGVVAAQIATVPSASVLQSMLANNSPSTDGAMLVGYYDTNTSKSYTVDSFLNTVYGQTYSSIIPSASATSLVNSTPKNVTTLSLSAGTYMVWGNINMPTSQAATSNYYTWVSATSAPTIPDASFINNIVSSGAYSGSIGLSAPMQIITLASAGTVYLIADYDGTATVTACGGLYALRIR
jgi:hypothetical protein